MDKVVTATVSIGEPFRVMPHAYARLGGRYGFLLIYPMLGTFAGVAIGSFLAVVGPLVLTLSGWQISALYLPILTGTIEVASGLAGLWLGLAHANRRYTQRYLAALIERGTPVEAEVRFESSDAGLSISDSRMSTLLRWPAILEIAPAPEHWFLVTGPSIFVLPRAAFATAEQERDFLAALLHRMTPQAEGRSGEAAAFVEEHRAITSGGDGP